MLLGLDVTVVGVLELDRGDVVDLAVDADLVEPLHPVQGGELKVVDAMPGSVVADALGLVEADHALGHGVDAPICQDASTKSFEVRSVGRVEPGWRR